MAELALLAQLVEHLHGKEGVNGSSPLEGFTFNRMVEPIWHRADVDIDNGFGSGDRHRSIEHAAHPVPVHLDGFGLRPGITPSRRAPPTSARETRRTRLAIPDVRYYWIDWSAPLAEGSAQTADSQADAACTRLVASPSFWRSGSAGVSWMIATLRLCAITSWSSRDPCPLGRQRLPGALLPLGLR